MKKCPICETLNEDSATNCLLCNEPFSESTYNEANSNTGVKPIIVYKTVSDKKSTSKLKKALISIFIIIALIATVSLATGAYFMKQKSDFNTAISQATGYYEIKNYVECLNTLETIKDNHYYQKSNQGYALEAMVYMDNENYTQAIEKFQQALNIVSDARCNINLAICHAKVGNKDEALYILSDINAQTDAVSYVEGAIHEANEEYQSAIQDYKKCISLTLDTSLKKNAYISQARIYRTLRHDGASDHVNLSKQIEVMEAAVKDIKDEDDLTLTEMMAEAYFTAKEYDLALQKFQRLTELGYERPYILRNIAIIHQQMGNLSSAEKTLLEMRDKYPDNSSCYTQLAFVYMEMESLKEDSEKDYSKVVSNYELAKKYSTNQSEDGLVQLENKIKELRSKGWIE